MKTSTAVPTIGDLVDLAYAAGDIMRQNFTLGMAREVKSDRTPVTASDKAINDLVVSRISDEYPGVRVIGEEGSNDVTESDVVVLVDPVDGTIPFCRGVPVSSFCASVLVEGVPQAAVIADPFQDRMWTAERGKGAFLNGMLTRVSSHATIAGSNTCAVWWTKSPYHVHEAIEIIMAEKGFWMNPCSIAYWGGLVASGEFEATIFPGRKGWETAAMSLIVEEAGGKATDIHGKPLVFGPNGEIEGHIISNGLIHEKLVGIVDRVQTF